MRMNGMVKGVDTDMRACMLVGCLEARGHACMHAGGMLGGPGAWMDGLCMHSQMPECIPQ